MKKLISILIACLIGTAFLDAQTVKIACVGNSITYGDGLGNRDKMSYPAQLQAWLGSGYTVGNFGVSGATMLRQGNQPYPYWNDQSYKVALNSFNSDIIVIELGTNDSKAENWVDHAGEFEGDYTDMVLAFKALDSKPRVLLALPTPLFTVAFSVRNSIIRDEIIPIIKKISTATNCQYIDLNTPFTPLLSWEWAFADGRHPNSIGASIIVEKVYRKIY